MKKILDKQIKIMQSLTTKIVNFNPIVNNNSLTTEDIEYLNNKIITLEDKLIVKKYFKIINFVDTPFQYNIKFNDDVMRMSTGSSYPNVDINNNGFMDLSQAKFYFDDELNITFISSIIGAIKIKIYDLNNNLIDDITLSQRENYIINQSCLIDIYREYRDPTLPPLFP